MEDRPGNNSANGMIDEKNGLKNGKIDKKNYTPQQKGCFSNIVHFWEG
jgi:hypothetical protein